MVSMLKAVGFSKGHAANLEDYLMDFAMEKAETEIPQSESNKEGNGFEFFIPVAENTGIVFRGIYNKLGKMKFTHLFPAHISTHESLCDSIVVNKRFDSDAYLAMCNDEKLGYMMFYVQNQHGIHSKEYRENPDKEFKIKLSALCEDGKIILPSKPVNVKEKVTAINGNMPINDKMQVFDTEPMDIYSVVDTTLHPAGVDNDCYGIVGVIKEIQEQKNRYTGEELYVFLIDCSNVLFEVCINKESLMGVPKVGRRFKGEVWLQGQVEWA